MKKGIVLVVFFSIFSISLMAHPPKSVTVTYNEGKLKVVAVHKVQDPTTHYIKTITVSVDGKVVKVLTYTSQTSAEEQNVEASLPDIKAGSTIKVKASCNRFGSRNGELKVQ
jgi:hypothetical protein